MRVPADRAHNRWHPDLEPVASVALGEEITLETRDGLDGQLSRASTHEDAGRLDLGLGHPLTGPVWVEGAEPGDQLEVELASYEVADYGVTAVIPGFGFLADLFPDPYVVHWDIEDGYARSSALPGVSVPEDVFAGVIGVAPTHALMEEIRGREQAIANAGGPVADPAPESALPPEAATGLRTIPPRPIGGNIDIRQLVAGSRLFLPVHIPGALFSIGDLHFAQGDGEVCGTAIEVAGAATVRFRIQKEHELGWRQRFPRFETPSERAHGPSLATTGIALDVPMDVDAAAREALLEMIGYLEATYGFERPAAYALCSVAVDLRISEAVDVPYPLVSALLSLDVFE
ncbi:MAG TPA: acetamidase/formamidase family protein [Gaiellaceae bacterium]|nr:acetamidase/formamidase family protein [Gaiellaceae bacterium]